MKDPRAVEGRFRRALASGRYDDAVAAIESERLCTEGEQSLVWKLEDPEGRVAPEDRIDVRNASSLGEALYELGVALWAQSGYEMVAVDVFSAAVAEGSTRAIRTLGESLHWFGFSERALPWLRAAAEDPQNDHAWMMGLLGEALVATGGDQQEAASCLSIGADAYREFGVPLAKLLVQQSHWDSAQRLLEALVEEQVYGAALLLGNLMQDHFHDYSRAEWAYRSGINSKDAFSAYNLGVLYWSQGRSTDAAEAFELARNMGDFTDPPAEVPNTGTQR